LPLGDRFGGLRIAVARRVVGSLGNRLVSPGRPGERGTPAANGDRHASRPCGSEWEGRSASMPTVNPPYIDGRIGGAPGPTFNDPAAPRQGKSHLYPPIQLSSSSAGRVPRWASGEAVGAREPRWRRTRTPPPSSPLPRRPRNSKFF